jgi:hypothetical protein
MELRQLADRPQPSWAQPEGTRDCQGGGREGAGQGGEGQVKEEGKEGSVIVHAAAGVLQNMHYARGRILLLYFTR